MSPCPLMFVRLSRRIRRALSQKRRGRALSDGRPSFVGAGGLSAGNLPARWPQWDSPARRPRCGVPRLRATRGGRHWLRGAPCGPAAFGVSSRGFAGRAFRPVLVLARRGFRNATPAARRRAARGTPHRGRRAERCGCAFASAGPTSGGIAESPWDFGDQRAEALVRLSHGTAPGRAVGCLAQRPSGGGRTRCARAAGQVGTAARHHRRRGDGNAQKSAGPQRTQRAE